MNFIDKLIRYNKNWKITIKKDTGTVFRAMVDYGATSNQGPYPLKIEVSSRNIGILKNNIIAYENIKGVNVYKVEEIIQMKVATFAKRDKIRDLYDLGFLLKTYPELFSRENLLNIYDNMGYKGLDDLTLLLDSEMQNNNLKEIDAEEYVLKLYEECERLLIEKGKNRNIIWGD